MSLALFDTNILVDWLRNRGGAVAEFKRHADHAISRIAWMEVLAGEPRESRAAVADLRAPFRIIDVDIEIANAAIEIRHRMRIGLLDAIIYATAQVEGAILVTRNIKDFPEGTPGVRIPYQRN